MSDGIYYQQLSPVSLCSGDRIAKLLKLPRVFTQDDIGFLEGLNAGHRFARYSGSDELTFVNILLTQLNAGNTIRVWMGEDE